MKLSTQPYKGTRDFYPADKRIQNYIFNTWRHVAERYGYEEYDAPLLESTEIYSAKSGEEIVDQQTYRFTDRGGRDVSIRPEMTPSVSRMIAGRRQELAYPARWYSMPNLWRYERPQHGRLREHWQLNVDIFGVSTIDAELELILVANDIMNAFGAKSDMYEIVINSRKLTSLIMADYLDLDADQSHQMIKLLDRRAKIPKETFESEAAAIFGSAQSDERLEKLAAITDAKSLGDFPEEILDNDHVKQIQLLFTHLKEAGVDNVRFDATVMRGFDYYTDVVFEVFDTHPDNNRSMFGGGRYDGLVGMFGVEPVATAGFGMGDVTMRDFLEAHDLLPELKSTTDVYLIPVGGTLRETQGLAKIMRTEGVNVAVDVSGGKLDKQLKNADKNAVRYVMFVGEDELTNEQFTLKDMDSGEETAASLERIITTVADHRHRDEDLESAIE